MQLCTHVTDNALMSPPASLIPKPSTRLPTPQSLFLLPLQLVRNRLARSRFRISSFSPSSSSSCFARLYIRQTLSPDDLLLCHARTFSQDSRYSKFVELDLHRPPLSPGTKFRAVIRLFPMWISGYTIQGCRTATTHASRQLDGHALEHRLPSASGSRFHPTRTYHWSLHHHCCSYCWRLDATLLHQEREQYPLASS